MKLVSLIEREERIQSTPQELAFLRNCTDLKRAIHSNEPLARIISEFLVRLNMIE